ncbi:unnamed protein product [Ostreobium quekettii]|uniref:Mce/MlaD domain-containing protein n=1 Tax=Ostreobium quekettii TaxID=121088 RepID=A0A8S1JBE3_9CHLO|nr:unnamed protein product [Ostreobium quekettii]
MASAGGDEDDGQPGFLDKISKMLRDFGIGRRSIWEGGVGAFVLGGAVLTFWLLSWARGSQLRKGRPYQATVVFPQACGITVGTPVRIRGVPVGSALNVTPRLDGVDVQIEVKDDGIVIPLNSVVEANQSGLIAEPFVDVTPQLPLPDFEAGPLSSDCDKDGKIVCHRGRIQGEQGVSLDDLVYICTKLARQMDADGVDSMFKAAESLSEALDIAQPLILQAAGFVEEMTPLLADLRSGGLVGNVEALTKSVAEAASDIQLLQKAVLDDENIGAIRGAVKTLTQTLQNVESIAGDMSVFTGDSKVMGNLKRLIGALSRIVEE